MATKHYILRDISVFYRLTQMHLSEKLKPYNLGCGHQYIMLQISRHPGASLAELADLGAFDNCTVTRAVQKLEGDGYIHVERCERDHRAKRVYLTERGEALIGPIRNLIGEWMTAVTAGFSEEEKALFCSLAIRLGNNARAVLANRADEREDNSNENPEVGG